MLLRVVSGVAVTAGVVPIAPIANWPKENVELPLKRSFPVLAAATLPKVRLVGPKAPVAPVLETEMLPIWSVELPENISFPVEAVERLPSVN